MCGHFLHKETGVNRKFVKYTMDFLSLPEYVIKKGRPHGHRYGKKSWETKELYTANQLKKKCKEKKFQGIHDRFLRDHEFRVGMIEHNRDEEVCRRWDVLADEDHTYHLSENNISTTRTYGGSIPISRVLTPYHWETVLISNKRCLLWNDYTKKLEKNHTCLLIPTSTNNGSWHKVRLLHGGTGKIPGGLLKIQKVKEVESKVLRMNGETRYW